MAALVLLGAGFYAGFRAAQPPPPPDFESLRAGGNIPDAPGFQPAETRTLSEPVPATGDAFGVSAPAPDPNAETTPDPAAIDLEMRRQPPPTGGSGKPRIALVIDDLGRSLQDVRTLKALGIPISYAVLPFETRTSEVVAALRKQGEEVLCHLPMEAKGGNNPGPGALLMSMDPDELRQATEAALNAVPGAVGLNNHMGSAVMSDVASIEAVLEVLGDRGLFFLDSRTTADTVGYSLARKRGIPTAERQVFLDTHRDSAFIRKQFEALLASARSRGGAIAIAHPYDETLSILAETVPQAVTDGFEFVTASQLMDR